MALVALALAHVPPAPVAAVQVPVARIPAALGRIEPVSDVVTLAPPQGSRAARIVMLLAAVGDDVVAGQNLAVMDNAGVLAAQLHHAELSLQQSRDRLAQRLAEMEIEEASLAAALVQEQATRDRVRWEHERASQLQQGGVYRAPALIDKRFALDAADQRVVSAELALARAARRNAAGQRLEEAVLCGQVAMAEAVVVQMRAELAMATLRSPIDGTVLRVNARPGEVAGSEGIMLLGDLRVMRVRAELFESDIGGAHPGQKVRISGRALPEMLHGEVEAVGLRVARQTLVREDPAAMLDARMVEVMVRLDGPSSAAARGFTGMQVRVFFGGAT